MSSGDHVIGCCEFGGQDRLEFSLSGIIQNWNRLAFDIHPGKRGGHHAV